MRTYIGFDRSEVAAYEVAQASLLRASPNSTVEGLVQEKLRSRGLLTRVSDSRGQPYDFISGSTCSTEFSFSRFLVPVLCQEGWALFTDCDVVFYQDVDQLMEYADPNKAVMVVKHETFHGYGTKMGGLKQTDYPRKNWSSVMLFNCDHPANRRLTVQDVNTRSGKELHQFYWLADDEIGELPPEWNWLVGLQPKPEEVAIAHFTLGGPWIPNQPHGEYDTLWLNAVEGRSGSD